MAKRKPPGKTEVIDGFSSVQALRHAGRTSEETRTRESSTRLPERIRDDKPSDAKATARRIGSTAMPARHELTCYECGFEFILTGRLDDTICSKCRAALKIKNYTVDGAWTQDIKTLGTIDVTAGAVVGAVSLVCGNMIIAGDVKACTIKVCRSTTLRNGAEIDMNSMTFTDLVIHPDCDLKLKEKLHCRHLEVRGRLKADVHAGGRVTVGTGAFFTGKIKATGLIVEDEAGLKADLNVSPAPKNG